MKQDFILRTHKQVSPHKHLGTKTIWYPDFYTAGIKGKGKGHPTSHEGPEGE